MTFKTLVWSALATVSILSCSTQISTVKSTEDEPKAIQLFNGKDLKNWTPKIRNYAVGENFGNTFRVEDGMMKVRYDQYDNFNFRYGHIAYNTPYSYYVLRVEYRFVGEQPKGGEGWAWRNSGAMLHGQDPKTMGIDQNFPISIEAQFLGGDNDPKSVRTTSNLCTPGTHVVMNDKLFSPHCINAKSKTYHGDQWVTAEFVVLGDSVIRHVLEGETVIEYSKPQIGGDMVDGYDPAVKKDGQPLTGGYIYLQSESHPIDFRKVELYDLEKYKKQPQQLDNIINKILTKKGSN
ncbi:MULTISPECIES: DUF1080 domain-containing protein [Sphingobacterium]|uniref:DUF1080 domain-containing protein n=1 Tax=Sphingobacterium litopenaei TaxID=2763500 RepID=A0ABR7YCE4_9SPHI|nr:MULTISPECIES: DUF1080 domain-containing protein [Sphingobacterium]MBD1428988.1 DUF1080 domain-containing protein [Sphingobacterium litopenaei]NGM72336.1 DUF1080 domain-containing protein [Sphingobacterium sp. SGL-16]